MRAKLWILKKINKTLKGDNWKECIFKKKANRRKKSRKNKMAKKFLKKRKNKDKIGKKIDMTKTESKKTRIGS